MPGHARLHEHSLNFMGVGMRHAVAVAVLAALGLAANMVIGALVRRDQIRECVDTMDQSLDPDRARARCAQRRPNSRSNK